ncbi:branched-chain-amino-acid transaminase [Candidatus Latescibacterota bacterium]
MKPDIWIDGTFVPWDKACIHPLCHSMQRGATLFESIDCLKTGNGTPVIFRLPEHLERFQNSASIIGMKLPYSAEALSHAVIQTVARSGLTSCTIRPLAFYAEPVFDIYPDTSRVSVVIGINEKKPLPESIRVNFSRLRKIENTSMPIKAKVSGNYIAPMITKSEAVRAGFDDTLMLDGDGFVTEGSTSNIFIVENGEIHTSPGDRILQGITRNTIMSLADRLQIPLSETFFPPQRLKQAEEVFISSSGLGVMPVVQVDDVVIGDGVPGPITKRLRSFYHDVATGRVSEFDGWLTYIDQRG